MSQPLPHRYLIALGSNLGDRAAYLHAAIRAVSHQLGSVLKVAPFFTTAPIGSADQIFLNSAMSVLSCVTPAAALAELLSIETALGRRRSGHWGNRTIDLDLLLWQRRDAGTWHSASWESASLVIPHRELLRRDFVLVPASLVAGRWRHPLTGKTLATECRERRYHLAAPPAQVSNCLLASRA